MASWSEHPQRVIAIVKSFEPVWMNLIDYRFQIIYSKFMKASNLAFDMRLKLAQWVTPIKARSDGISSFYPQQSSCQIPNLWFLYSLFLGEKENGVFVEIGAFDGVTVSNTWGLAVRNWSGLMVEPVPSHAEKCRTNHALHKNIRVVETAVGSKDMDEISIHVSGLLTTANGELFSEYKTVSWASDLLSQDIITVPNTDLDSLLSRYSITPGFDLLVVDVEGLERVVFDNFDLAHWSPKMLIVELADTHPDLSATRSIDAQLGLEITSSNYRVVYKDSINTVFVRNEPGQ